LQRITAALESKIDVTSFESLVRAVNSKAERADLEHMRQREPAQNTSAASENALLSQQLVHKIMSDIDSKVLGVQRDWQLTAKDFATELENLK